MRQFDPYGPALPSSPDAVHRRVPPLSLCRRFDSEGACAALGTRGVRRGRAAQGRKRASCKRRHHGLHRRARLLPRRAFSTSILLDLYPGDLVIVRNKKTSTLGVTTTTILGSKFCYVNSPITAY